jgi:DNA-binding response OmpR family regulator
MVKTKNENQKHVLIVEDDVFLAGIYKKKFEVEGFKVSISEDGKNGIEDAKKKKPDIILLDVLLPKLDGFAVLKILKENKETNIIPVILLTNLGQKDDIEKGLEAGAVDYLIKIHFKPSEVVDKVRKILKI